VISGRDIVVLSSLDWDYLWQAPHELASRLALAGNRVLYVENLGIRPPRLGDARRVASRLGGAARSLSSGGTREVAPGLHVFSPLVLPPFGSPSRRAVNRFLFLPVVRHAARRLGVRDPILWTYLPTDAVLDLIDVLRTPRSAVVYMCLADFEELTPRRDRLGVAERALLESSDIVFARGAALTAHCARWSNRVQEIELGVTLEEFSMAAEDDREPQRDERPGSCSTTSLADLPRPIVGYVGALHRHLDLSLVVELAAARPEWSWVYVGPEQVPVGELDAHPNVHLIGHVPHGRLPACIRSLDVCVVPYRLGAATETVLPAKLLEYLAMGKPVVSTPLPEVRRFNAQRQVIAIAPSEPRVFVAAIEEALASDSEELRVARRRAVAPLDWGAQVERMSALIESAPPHQFIRR
jgi:glycosyltransferase involved in cell wall biosynthesis